MEEAKLKAHIFVFLHQMQQIQSQLTHSPHTKVWNSREIKGTGVSDAVMKLPSTLVLTLLQRKIKFYII